MKDKDPAKIDAIFKATLQLTAQTGLAGLKMSDIAKQAHIASGTLYVYFASKEALLNALYQKLKKMTLEASLSNTQRNDEPYKLRMKRTWKAAFMYRITHAEEFHFMEQFANSPYIVEASKAISREYMQNMTAFIEEGKRQLLLKDIDTRYLLLAMAGLLREFALQCAQKLLPINDILIEESFAICWDAIKA